MFGTVNKSQQLLFNHSDSMDMWLRCAEEKGEKSEVSHSGGSCLFLHSEDFAFRGSIAWIRESQPRYGHVTQVSMGSSNTHGCSIWAMAKPPMEIYIGWRLS